MIYKNEMVDRWMNDEAGLTMWKFISLCSKRQKEWWQSIVRWLRPEYECVKFTPENIQ